jgi:hypothetical protein
MGDLASRARALTANLDKTMDEVQKKDAEASVQASGKAGGKNPFGPARVAVKAATAAGRGNRGSSSKPVRTMEELQERCDLLEVENAQLRKKLTSLRKAGAATTRVVKAATVPTSLPTRPHSRGREASPGLPRIKGVDAAEVPEDSAVLRLEVEGLHERILELDTALREAERGTRERPLGEG